MPTAPRSRTPECASARCTGFADELSRPAAPDPRPIPYPENLLVPPSFCYLAANAISRALFRRDCRQRGRRGGGFHRAGELPGLSSSGLRSLEAIEARSRARLPLAPTAKGCALPVMPCPRPSGADRLERELRDMPRRRTILRRLVRDEGR